jgi:hypothetical protein
MSADVALDCGWSAVGGVGGGGGVGGVGGGGDGGGGGGGIVDCSNSLSLVRFFLFVFVLAIAKW